jgi:adenylosuccinate lyase
MNIRLLSMTDVSELQEPFDPDAQQGSSAMPHKRNPELSERITGLSRRAISAAAEELNSAVLWLERDISHSSTERFTLPDVFGCVAYAARLMERVLSGMLVDEERMLANVDASFGAIYASRLLNALIDKGSLTRSEAYDLVKELALEALNKQAAMRDLAISHPVIGPLLGVDLLSDLFSPAFYLRNMETSYSRLGLGATDSEAAGSVDAKLSR